jgi:hypothetical protein
MNIHLKLRQFANAKYGSIKEFAKVLGMEAPSLQVYLREPGDSRSSKPGYPILSRLRKLGCDMNWLLDDSDHRSYQQLINSNLSQLKEEASKSSIFLYIHENKKEGIYKYSIHNLEFNIEFMKIYKSDEISCYGLSPTINIGDLVITDSRYTPKTDDLCVCVFFDNITGTQKFIIRHYLEEKEEALILYNYKEENSKILIDKSVIESIHKVVHIIYNH